MKIKNQLIWKEVEDYVFITLGLMLYAFAFTIFLMPYKIVTGGVTGTAAIVFYATKIPIQDTYMVINGLLLVVALKILGLKFLLKPSTPSSCSPSCSGWLVRSLPPIPTAAM